VHQALGIGCIVADELGVGAVRLGAGVAGHIEPGSLFAELGTGLAFEARTAVQQQ